MKTGSTYRGDPNKDGFSGVTVDGKKLDPRRKVRDHSTTGFSWGYEGSGPAQLALAILCDFLGNTEEAQSVYQEFKSEIVAGLPQGQPWVLTGQQIVGTQCVKDFLAKNVMET